MRTVNALVLLFIVSSIFAACGTSVEEESETAHAEAVEEPRPALTQASPRREALPESGTIEGRIADARLEARVLLALADDDAVSAYPFHVEARDGRVFIRGSVNTNAHRERIDAVVRDMDGVLLVVNEVESLEPVTATARNPADSDTPPAEVEPAPGELWHTVQSGESLWTIARRHGTSVQNIQRLNSLGSGSIRPGQRLRVR